MKKRLANIGIATAGFSTLAAELDLSKLPAPADRHDVTYAKDIRPILEKTAS